MALGRQKEVSDNRREALYLVVVNPFPGRARSYSYPKVGDYYKDGELNAAENDAERYQRGGSASYGNLAEALDEAKKDYNEAATKLAVAKGTYSGYISSRYRRYKGRTDQVPELEASAQHYLEKLNKVQADWDAFMAEGAKARQWRDYVEITALPRTKARSEAERNLEVWKRLRVKENADFFTSRDQVLAYVNGSGLPEQVKKEQEAQKDAERQAVFDAAKEIAEQEGTQRITVTQDTAGQITSVDSTTIERPVSTPSTPAQTPSTQPVTPTQVIQDLHGVTTINLETGETTHTPTGGATTPTETQEQTTTPSQTQIKEEQATPKPAENEPASPPFDMSTLIIAVVIAIIALLLAIVMSSPGLKRALVERITA